MRKSFIYLDSDSEEEHKDVNISIYVIGLKKAGKTSFIKRLLYNEFSLSYFPTRLIEIYRKKTFHIQGLSLTLELVDIPDNFTLKKTKTNDILVIFVNDKLPKIPNIPIRTWLLYRKKKYNICPSNRIIHIDNMENIGFDIFLNSIIKEYS